MSSLDVNRIYLVNGKHRVLGLFRDATSIGSYEEYVCVYEDFDTGKLKTAFFNYNGFDALGRTLEPVKPYVEENYSYEF